MTTAQVRRLLRAGCLGLLATAAAAGEIEVGSTRLEIPAPDGFTLVTDDMQPYAQAFRRFVPAQFRLFAVFVSPEDAELAAEGGVPTPKRFFYVMSAEDILYRPISADDFAAMRSAMKAQNDRLAKEIADKAPGLMREINEGFAKEGVDLALSLSQVVPFPPHHESERSLAFSMFTKFGMAPAGGSASSFEASATATVTHLKAKILFLYAVGEKADLAWTRDASRTWADAIIAANPSTGEAAEQERRGKGFSTVDLYKLVVIAAVAAGIAGLFLARPRRRRREPQEPGSAPAP